MFIQEECMTKAEEAAARAAAEAEAAERARQARIAELRGQLSAVESEIRRFENILRRLTDARTSMNSYSNSLYSSITVPSISYVLHGASDWEGVKAVDADNIKVTVRTQNTGYESDVKKLLSDIGRGVDNANSRLQSLYNRRNGILGELRSLGA